MNFSHFLLLATVSIFAAQSGGTFAFQAEIAQLANGTGNNKENLEKTLTIMDAGNGMTKAGRGSIDKSGTTQAFVATNQQLLSPSEDIYFSVSPHSRLRYLSEMSNSWCSDDIEEVLLNQCYPDYDFSHTKRAAFTTVTYHEERLFPAADPPAPPVVPPAAAIDPPVVVLSAAAEVPPAGMEVERGLDGTLIVRVDGDEDDEPQ
ncbi:hypothetical protein niasHT_015264 [Heterodera trifolii]|uniref:Effector protein n=1 Tax=Heterodera trifolii TaxID=157864 RepID=A0ABD2L4N1_9BILA